MAEERLDRRSKKRQRRNLFLGLFIVAIMILSVLGYTATQNSQSNAQNYNGHSFAQSGEYWVTKMNKKVFEFNFLPSQVDYLSSDKFTFDPAYVYLVSDPNANYSTQDLAAIDYSKFELKNKIVDYLGVDFAEIGYTQEYLGRHPITCANATPSVVVIDFIVSNQTKISFANNCLTFSANVGIDIVKEKDFFLYKELGIIKEK